MKILLIGYGNPGRLDDGLGPALAEKFQALESRSVAAQKNFQPLENPPRPEATPPVEGNSDSCIAESPLGKGGAEAGVGCSAGGTPEVTVESNYQLNVEDAAQIAEYDVVVFADASADAEPPFAFEPLEPEAGGLSFSSHSVSAPQLMGMVKELFHAEPQAYMLAIRGFKFNEFGEELSAGAKENLEQAVTFLKGWL